MSMSLSLTRLMRCAELGDQQLGRVLVDGLGERDRRAHLEQGFDEVGAALGHAVGELLHGDRLRERRRRGPACATGRPPCGGAFPSRARGGARQASGRGCRLRRQSARLTVSLPRWRSIVAAAARTRGFGALGRGSVAAGRRKLRSSPSSVSAAAVSGSSGGGAVAARASSSARRASFFGGRFVGLAILFGAAALVLDCASLGAFLAAARFLERGQARFLGFAQQAASEAPCAR